MSEPFEAITLDLPSHQDEVMNGSEGAPSIAEQDRTHGAGLPAGDTGIDDMAKYGTGPC